MGRARSGLLRASIRLGFSRPADRHRQWFTQGGHPLEVGYHEQPICFVGRRALTVEPAPDNTRVKAIRTIVDAVEQRRSFGACSRQFIAEQSSHFLGHVDPGGGRVRKPHAPLGQGFAIA